MEAYTEKHEDDDQPEELKIVKDDKKLKVVENERQFVPLVEKFTVVKKRKSRKTPKASKKTKLIKNSYKSTHIKFDESGYPSNSATEIPVATPGGETQQQKRKKFKPKSAHLKQIIANTNLHIPPVLASLPHISKYWAQRYRLFSKYDEGVQLDGESWYHTS